MFSSWRQRLSAATLVQLGADLLWLIIAVVIALYIEQRPIREFVQFVAPAMLFALIIVAINGALGGYRHDRKLSMLVHVTWLLAAAAVAIPVVYTVSLSLPAGEEFRGVLGVAGLAAFGGLIILRHAVVGPLLASFATNRVLVLGTGADAHAVESSLASSAATNVQLIAFYRLDKVPETSVSTAPILSPDEPLLDAVRRLEIHEVLVAVRQQRGGVLPLRQLLDCRLSGVRVIDLAKFFERVHGRVPIESVKASWLIYGEGFRQSWIRRFTKRTFDIAVSLVILTVMAPVMVVVALLIALETGYPIIYRQERVGYGGRTFVIRKFRSMRNDAETEGARWASLHDSRTTSVGRLLRQTRLDELPQLFNVLRGDMSFVGPRPERPPFVSMLTAQIPFYAVRHSVKPGITGWAQVRYSYGASVEDSSKKLEYDLYYVKNNTLWLDLKILLETVRVVLLREGAR